uniref:Uncharacterized protein n=1 Tax=Tanacetum cinerariifolium TaxID=118510 RepID=A0A6L2K3M6_TANCI|nr:hypothetical protein [Tanacetum cinerariifolium]
MDEALIPHARRLRIERSNFRLLSDIASKESTLQLVYDVMLTVYHHSIRFKMDNKKHIVNLESFKEMLHICPRLPDQSFIEPPFKEEILAFLHFLGHNGAIRRLTNVEHKDTKKSNEMYSPRFTNVIIHHFMSKDPSIPRRNKFGALLPIELTNEDIRNFNTYKEYYAFATGATPPKPKSSVQKTRSSFDTSITPLTADAGSHDRGQQLKLATKRSLQQIHISQESGSGVDERTGTILGVPNVPTNESKEEISYYSTDEEGDDDDGNDGDGDDEGNDEDDKGEEIKDEKSFDPIPKTPENTDDEGNGEENLGTNVGKEEGHDEEEEEEEDELCRDVNINLGRGIESIFETTSRMDVQTPTSVAPFPMSAPTLTPSTIATITSTQQAPTPPTTAPSTLLQDLSNFGLLFGFDHRLKTLEANFSEFMQTNQFAGAVSSILGIVQRYMDQRMNEAVKVSIQIKFDHLYDEAQAENEEFLKTINENMQKIIKEQVKEQVKVQVSKILLKIEQTVNEQLKAKVLTRSSNSSKTSYVVAADLSEMELKKILIEKIECNNYIQRSTEQRNLYKALVEAYESDKIILDTYRDTVTLKRRRDDDVDKDEEPSAGSDRGSKRRRERKEPESASAPKEKAARSRSAGKSTQGSKSRQTLSLKGADDQPIVEPSQHPEWFSQQKKPPTLDQEVCKATTDQLDWDNPEGQQYPHNLLKSLPLIPNNRGRRVIPFDHFINNDLEYLRGGASSRKYITSVTMTKAADYGHIKWIEDLMPRTMWIQEPIGYDKHRRIIVVNKLKIVEWHNYKHLDWITMRRDDDKLYKFKEGDFKRLRIQDIEDMLLLLVQGKLTNLTVEKCFAFNKKLNLTKSDTYRSDLKRKEAYITNLNPKGFIYQNKDLQNRLMRINELHKFNDGTLTDVRTALDDHFKRIQMKYLPQSIWRKSDKDRATAMIQPIDKRLKTRRIMKSLERFVGGRLYEGDFRMLQRTI